MRTPFRCAVSAGSLLDRLRCMIALDLYGSVTKAPFRPNLRDFDGLYSLSSEQQHKRVSVEAVTAQTSGKTVPYMIFEVEVTRETDVNIGAALAEKWFVELSSS